MSKLIGIPALLVTVLLLLFSATVSAHDWNTPDDDSLPFDDAAYFETLQQPVVLETGESFTDRKPAVLNPGHGASQIYLRYQADCDASTSLCQVTWTARWLVNHSGRVLVSEPIAYLLPPPLAFKQRPSTLTYQLTRTSGYGNFSQPVAANAYGQVTYTYEADGPTRHNNGNLVSFQGPGQRTVTWTATDSLGRSVSKTETLIIEAGNARRSFGTKSYHPGGVTCTTYDVPGYYFSVSCSH